MRDFANHRPRPYRAALRRSRAVVATIAGCGHAPALNTPEQFALVERFLAAGNG